MTRAVFLGYPARGHTAPSLPVVRALVRRGLAVDYHSTSPFQGLVEAAGARFVPYPEGFQRLSCPADTGEHLARTLQAAEQVLPSLLARLAPGPELVMFDASALWGGLAARRLRRPCVASITTFALTRPMLQMLGSPTPAAWAAPVTDRLNTVYDAGWRHPLDVMVPAADLKLVYTSRAFQPAGRFFDDSHLFLGPLLGERPREGSSATGPAEPRPLAYVSLGTIFNDDQALLRLVARSLAEMGWRVVVSLGQRDAPEGEGWPDHVQVHGFVEQIGVLGEAQLFITHGGMNSVSEALSHAVPMIIIPRAVDQHMVAARAAGLGAAVVIGREHATAASLRAAIARITRDRSAFESAARRVQAGLAEATPLAEAVDRILALSGREDPLDR